MIPEEHRESLIGSFERLAEVDKPYIPGAIRKYIEAGAPVGVSMWKCGGYMGSWFDVGYFRKREEAGEPTAEPPSDFAIASTPACGYSRARRATWLKRIGA